MLLLTNRQKATRSPQSTPSVNYSSLAVTPALFCDPKCGSSDTSPPLFYQLLLSGSASSRPYTKLKVKRLERRFPQTLSDVQSRLNSVLSSSGCKRRGIALLPLELVDETALHIKFKGPGGNPHLKYQELDEIWGKGCGVRVRGSSWSGLVVLVP